MAGFAAAARDHARSETGTLHFKKPRRDVQLVFAPVWLLLTEQGLFVLDEYVDAQHEIGVHVYDRVPDHPEDRPSDFDGLDIFTAPGEVRDIR